MRVHLVKIPPGVAVKLAVRVQHHRRNPDGRRAERLDVIQFLLDALEIAAVNGRAAVAGRFIIAVGVVVRRVAVVKAVGDDLVNALRLPEGVAGGLRGDGKQECQQRNCGIKVTGDL